MNFRNLLQVALTISTPCFLLIGKGEKFHSLDKQSTIDTLYFLIDNKVELKEKWGNPTGVESVEAVVSFTNNELIVRPRKLGEFSVTLIYNKRIKKRSFFSIYLPKPGSNSPLFK